MILVIDNNLDSQEILCACLERDGFNVVTARDGMAGFQAARRYLPELIIADIDIPWMDGFQVLADLRREPATAQIPFIVCTSVVGQIYKSLAERMGANAYLTKPLDITAFKQVVHQQLQNQVKH